MSVSANRARFTLSVAGLATELRVLAFSGREAVSELFEFDLEVVSSRAGLDLANLLNRDAALQLSGDSGRQIHGTIRAASQGTTTQRFTHYHLTVAPRLYWLSLRHNVRIFQNLAVPDIVRQLLTEANIGATFYRFELTRTYQVRNYCVQYNESELHFIERLLQDEGIHYHFEHHPDRHVLVIADHGNAFKPLEPRQVAIRPDAAMVGEECIQTLKPERTVAVDTVALTDYNYRKPNHSLFTEAKAGAESESPSFAWPGGYQELPIGDSRTRDRIAAQRLGCRPATGRSVVPRLATGRIFQLSQHPQPSFNRDWLVLSITHEGQQPQVLEELAGVGGSRYHNDFMAIPADQSYRPPLTHAKPYAHTQTAIVAGPPGEQVYTDEYGNLQVRFHWDREGKHSCWLRLAQRWAGNFWGSVVLPRVGQEVIIDFLNGDPDQPIVTGCLYHGLHEHPYPLPDHRSRTLLRSQSLAGGDGHELMLEDKAGQEKIAIHSSRDMELHVTQDSKTSIDRHVHTSIGGTETTTIQGAQHLTANTERRTRIAQQDSLDIGQALHVKAGTAIHLQSGQSLNLKAGMKAALAAGVEVVLKVGGSSVVLNPGGMHVNGPAIHLTGGGSAGAAAEANPQTPLTPQRIGGPKIGKPLLSAPLPNPPTPADVGFANMELLREQILEASRADQPALPLCQKPVNGPCSFRGCACSNP